MGPRPFGSRGGAKKRPRRPAGITSKATMKFNVPESLVKGPIKEIPDNNDVTCTTTSSTISSAAEFSAYQEIRVQLPIDFRLPETIPKRNSTNAILVVAPPPGAGGTARTTSTTNNNKSLLLVPPPFRVQGYNWTITCYEGPASTGATDFVAIQMQLAEPSPLPAKLRGKFIFAVHGLPSSEKVSTAAALTTEKVWGLDKFASKRELQDFVYQQQQQRQQQTGRHTCGDDDDVAGGRVTIVVRVSISLAHVKPLPFQPRLPSGGQWLLDEILKHGAPKTRKVTFMVAPTTGTTSARSASTSAVDVLEQEEESCCTMHLPVTLCKRRLPQLVALLQREEDDDDDDDAANKTKKEAVTIDGLIVPMTMTSFRLFLSIALTGLNTTPTTTAPETKQREEISRHAFQLLDLADRFGFIELKLYMETHLAVYHLVDVESALYLLAIAHSRNCALLKECCMDYVNSPHIFATAVASSQWSDVVEAAPELHWDLYRRLGLTQANGPAPPRSMSALYKELEQRGLSLEGTRQQLEDRLLGRRFSTASLRISPLQ